jgi:hypothetical protein
MPATILPFERRDPAPRAPELEAAAPAEPARFPPLKAVPPRRLPTSRHTSRQTAHRWAMLSHLSHLSRRFAPPGPRDPVR